MIHYDDGVLRAWIDRELSADTHPGVGAHIEGCADCRARIREMRGAEEVVREALRRLDGPVPHDLAWARVSAGIRAPVATARPAVSPGAGWGSLARAAGITLFLAGGLAAAALPGSPLRSLWAPAPAETPAATLEAAAATADREAGIRAPNAAPVRIVLTAPAGTAVEIVFDGVRAGVFGPASTSFAAAEGVLRAQASVGPLRVEVPRDAQRVEIESNGTVVAVVEGGAFTQSPNGGSSDPDGTRVRFEVR